MKILRILFFSGILALACGLTTLTAQVTIGSHDSPQDFSVLELISNNNRGLRLPQMSNADKITAFNADNSVLKTAGAVAQGLEIFNTSTRCVETWNGAKWITACAVNVVTYKANGGTGNDISIEVEAGSYTIADNTFIRANHVFLGWNTAADGSGTDYAVNASVNIDGDLNLYAKWLSIPPPSGITPLDRSYVGAFWRNSQTGERLIRINVGTATDNIGAWTATVVTGDFIKMDLQNTTDTHVNWTAVDTPDDMNVGANDAAHQVSGNATSVSGTVTANGYIYFRIGLTSTNGTPTNAPRYGRILLTYNNGNKYQYLYIRQGEAADYIFAPTETYNNGLNPRTYAAKVMPYNLTASTMSDGADYADLAVRGGSFVDYPTQTGAFFQFAGDAGYERRAYHPSHLDVVSTSWSGGTTGGASGTWTTLAANHETCPAGFRRPKDDVVNEPQTNNPDIANSEIRQTFFLNPPVGIAGSADNFISGYYADGFFDRRFITTANGYSGRASFSAVLPTSKDVAYIGAMFYNPATQHSIFFPSSGRRDYSDGSLQNTGGGNQYWTGSTNSNGSLFLELHNANIHSVFRTDGMCVRCVAE